MKAKIAIGLTTAIGFLFLGVQLTGRGMPIATASGTYATSQVDTVTFPLEGTETSMYFYIHASDSVSVTKVIVGRIVDSQRLKTQSGDTVISSFTATTNDTLVCGSVAVNPSCEKVQIVVTYAGSGQGVTTPNVKYLLSKKY